MKPTSPSADRHVVLSPSVYARAFGAELVLLDFGKGEYFALDEVGAEIWRGLERGAALGPIAEGLAARWSVEPDEALRDVTELVARLRTEGLVRTA